MPYNWWQLQVDYYRSGAYEEFAKEKLFWIDLSDNGRFSYDNSETFCVNTVYMISGTAIKYLCAVLNSHMVTWYMKNFALTSGMGTTRWFSNSVNAIPIPRISVAKQRPFIRLIDTILETKASNPDASTIAYEKEIDWQVYRLYGLTQEEIAVVENRRD